MLYAFLMPVQIWIVKRLDTCLCKLWHARTHVINNFCVPLCAVCSKSYLIMRPWTHYWCSWRKHAKRFFEPKKEWRIDEIKQSYFVCCSLCDGVLLSVLSRDRIDWYEVYALLCFSISSRTEVQCTLEYVIESFVILLELHKPNKNSKWYSKACSSTWNISHKSKKSRARKINSFLV